MPPLFCAIILMAHILHLYILKPALQHYNCCFIQFCFALKRDENLLTLYIFHLWHSFCIPINSCYHLLSLPFNVKGFLKSLRMLSKSDMLLFHRFTTYCLLPPSCKVQFVLLEIMELGTGT